MQDRSAVFQLGREASWIADRHETLVKKTRQMFIRLGLKSEEQEEILGDAGSSATYRSVNR